MLEGEIGQYAIMARRSGDVWYVGAMNDSQARSFQLPLQFLQPNRQYTAHVYRDDPSVDTRTHVRVEQVAVTSRSQLELELAAKGGQAIRMVPVR